MTELWRMRMVVTISILFVGLYAGASLGLIDGKPNADLLGVLQPVVWVIIGYYFGRVPGERVESRLKEQVDKSDAEARAAKDKAEESELAAKAASNLAASAARTAAAATTRISAAKAILRAAPAAPGHLQDATGDSVVTFGKPTTASAVNVALTVLGASLSCRNLAAQAIEDWAGSPVTSKSDVLADLYLASGKCDNGSLRALRDLLNERCEAAVEIGDLSCSMTVGDVQKVVCG